jgi:hypothetical protein
MMIQFTPSLMSSFPWLTEDEAAVVAQQLAEAGVFASAADQLAAFAAVLDRVGLPPTSTLLLSLAGRGSKATAVSVSRATARARFEQARQHAARVTDANAAGTVAKGDLDVDQVRDLVHATVESVLAALPGAFGTSSSDERIFKLLEGVSGEMRWLRSTIDTERQLRRYREVHGPLPEHQASQGPAAAEERRGVVQQLANSLERERFQAHVARQIDSADGREE